MHVYRVPAPPTSIDIHNICVQVVEYISCTVTLLLSVSALLTMFQLVLLILLIF